MADDVETIKRLEAAWAASDDDAVREILAPDFKNGGAGAENSPPGVDGVLELHRMSVAAFPDKTQELLTVFGEGDKVVAEVRMTGTNKGGLPWVGVPANDKPVDITWITIYTLKDGKVIETAGQMDVALMMQQLGMGGEN